jgi:metal-responsive CopG/Arc/MetJ family transcriptional regulator
MKTAVSIPDKVFNSAEKLAKQLRKSRSELYTQAISNYVTRHQADEVSKKLDDIYGIEMSSVDPMLTKIQASTVKEQW